MVSEKKVVDADVFKIQRIEGEIVEVILKDHTNLEIPHILEMRVSLMEFIDNEPLNHKLLVSTGQFTTISREAREFSVKNRVSFKAEAYVINQLHQIIGANFVSRISRKFNKNTNIRLFKRRDSALKWLKEQ